MALTDTICRNAKAADKPQKLSDAGGLHLFISPSGGRLWRMAYRFEGKQKQLSFGAYPAVSLKDARERRDAAKAMLATGVDPGAARKQEKAAVEAAGSGTRSIVWRDRCARPPKASPRWWII